MDASRLVAAALSSLDARELPRHVVAAGKAAAGMFEAACRVGSFDGAVVTAARGPGSTSASADWFASGHPAPNQASADAAERALAVARDAAGARGLLILLSGGASAMLAAPVEGVTLDEKVETARTLMRAGAAIDELNCVRKHLSRIKGGRLAAAAGRTVTLALSDVHAPVADDPAVIGSGVSVPDPTTYDDALAVLRRRGVRVPDSVVKHLSRGARGEIPETVKPGDPRIVASRYEVIGSRQTAAHAAQLEAEALGYRTVVVPEAIVGEARDEGARFVEQARRLAGASGTPLCLIGSGETTVTVRGAGRGGRNQEFALGAAIALGEWRDAVVGSAGTDGVDGPTDAAGAIVDRATLDRAAHLGLDPSAALADNDAYAFLAAVNELLMWGPTGTNVGDLHVLLVVAG